MAVLLLLLQVHAVWGHTRIVELLRLFNAFSYVADAQCHRVELADLRAVQHHDSDV